MLNVYCYNVFKLILIYSDKIIHPNIINIFLLSIIIMNLIYNCKYFLGAVKEQNKFKHSSQNGMEDIIKYVLAQAPFNLKIILDKNFST